MSNDNFDSILDANLDDLADLPEFANFPAGVHRCTVSMQQKTINSKPAIEVTLTAIETVELSKPEEDKPVSAGQVSSAAYFMDNEFGQGAFKKLVAPLAGHLGVTSLREIIEQAAGTECEAVTAFRMGKAKPGETERPVYFEIKKLIIA
jgi:hypothetical protein